MVVGGCTAEELPIHMEAVQQRTYLSTAIARRWRKEAVWTLDSRGHTYLQLWLEGGGRRLYGHWTEWLLKNFAAQAKILVGEESLCFPHF